MKLSCQSTQFSGTVKNDTEAKSAFKILVIVPNSRMKRNRQLKKKGFIVYLRDTTLTTNRVLDFNTQAEQMIQLIESRLKSGDRAAAVDFLKYKFKTLYEIGVASGRDYETRGEFPY